LSFEGNFGILLWALRNTMTNLSQESGVFVSKFEYGNIEYEAEGYTPDCGLRFLKKGEKNIITVMLNTFYIHISIFYVIVIRLKVQIIWNNLL
jgi:hypothetical protein